MEKRKSRDHGDRFPAALISCAVRWYFRFQFSLIAEDLRSIGLRQRDAVW
jgi:transposase-like protein